MKQRLSPLAAVALCVAVLAGCATTDSDDLAALRVAAEQAAADAADAKRMATEAEREAAAAKLAAEQARADAAAARAQADDTESRIDRMFKKAMYK